MFKALTSDVRQLPGGVDSRQFLLNGGTNAALEKDAPDRSVVTFDVDHVVRALPLQVWIRIVGARWLDIVSTLASPSSINIWQASSRAAWRYGEPGDIVLLKREQGRRTVAGYGFVCSSTIDFASRSWTRFGRGNGADSLDEFLDQIVARRTQRGAPDPAIGNTLIESAVFFPRQNPLVLPADLFPTFSPGALATLDDPAGQELLRRLSKHALRKPDGDKAPMQATLALEAANDRGRIRIVPSGAP